MENFMKQDNNKIIASEVTPRFILGTAKVLTFGAKKYERGNWIKMTEEDRVRINDSLLRHTYSYLSGEKLDPETGLSHLYHMACNLMFLDNLDKNLEEKDINE